MILVSNGGSNISAVREPSETMLVGTVDGVFLLERAAGDWRVARHALAGCSISAVTRTDDGTLFAASHGVGVARSRDEGSTWQWCNAGLTQFDLWSARGGKLQGRDAVFVGSMPAHLFVSTNEGDSWGELTAMRDVESAESWCFPPPPRLGHVKDIVLDGERLLVGIEIGAMLVSYDFGRSFTDLRLDPDPTECDVHRIVVDPARPDRIVVANGLVGIVRTHDGGATWARNAVMPGMEYPDAIVMHPAKPNLLFMCVGVGWPPRWYQAGRAQGKIARSTDGGATWERLLGGLPNGQRALFSALSLEACHDGCQLYAVDTDGQLFESLDDGDSWRIVADIAPVSKGEFFRALAKDRRKLATVDDMVINDAAAARFATAGALTSDVKVTAT